MLQVFTIIGATSDSVVVQIGSEHEVLKASFKQMLDGYKRYRVGASPSDAFPFLANHELEFLVTGNPFSVQVGL